MLLIKELLQNYIENNQNSGERHLNQRNELMKKFVDRLNAGRIASGFPPMNPGFIASKMYRAGLKQDWELRWFYVYCDEDKNFNSTWWWSLDPKNVVK